MSRSDPRIPTFATDPQPLDDNELPSNADADTPRTVWEKVTEFRGSIVGSRINNSGEVTLTIAVPYEDKYIALPVTDTRGILMVFSVYKPQGAEHIPVEKDMFIGHSGNGE